MSLSEAGRVRLDALRDSNPRGYRSEQPVTQQDSGGSVEITIDATGWVIKVELTSLPDEMRSPEGFESAVREAYTKAQMARRLANLELESPDELAARRERARDVLEGRRPATTARAKAPKFARPYGPVKMPSPAELPAEFRTFSGFSRDGEIEVAISRGNGLVDLKVDPAWLSSTDPLTAHHALREAFAAAYQKGESL